MIAMILAAGLGTRLRPYTLIRPKPLFPVCGRPLLAITVDKLRAAGFSTIIINCHHLAGQIAEQFADDPGVIIQKEEMILGTGGGLRRAMCHFSGQPVLVVNGDIYYDIDLAEIYGEALACEAPVTMVMHDLARFNCVMVTGDSRVAGFGKETPTFQGTKKLAFTGIHVLEPGVLNVIPENEFYNIIDCYRWHIESGGQIRAKVVSNHYWADIGTPHDYLELHGYLMRKGLAGSRMRSLAGADVFVGKNVKLGSNVQVEGWAVVGDGADIRDGALLTRSVVWDGCTVNAGEIVRDRIVCD